MSRFTVQGFNGDDGDPFDVDPDAQPISATERMALDAAYEKMMAEETRRARMARGQNWNFNEKAEPMAA